MKKKIMIVLWCLFALTAIYTPVAALLYEKWNIEILFFIVGTALLIAAAFEARIDYTHIHRPRDKQNRLR